MTGLLQNDGIRVTERLNCLVCGKAGGFLYSDQRDRLFETSGRWDVMKCLDCELIWLSKVPVSEDIAKLYPPTEAYASAYHKAATAPRKMGLKNFVLQSILYVALGYRHISIPRFGILIGALCGSLPFFRKRAAFHVNFLEGSETGKLLDVGCGGGDFLSTMTYLGWDAHGVEPDSNAADRAEQRTGVKVFRCTLEEARFPDNHFDAITLNHVIEHLESPGRTIAEICRVIKPGGKIVITTPNVTGLCHETFAKDWYHLDLPRHLVMFSPQSLRSLTTTCGLSVCSLFTVRRQIAHTYLASTLIARHGRIPGFFSDFSGISLKDRLSALLFSIITFNADSNGRGEEIVIVLTK